MCDEILVRFGLLKLLQFQIVSLMTDKQFFEQFRIGRHIVQQLASQ